MNKLILGFVGAVLLIATSVIAWQTFSTRTEFANLETAVDAPRKHVQNAKFNDVPPMGGDHNAKWQNCGVYEAPVKLEHAVHSMEHGAVWVVYRSNVSAATKKQLRDIAFGRPYVILSPLEKMDMPIAVVAWGRRIKMKTVDTPVIKKFIQKFAGSLEAPEPAGPCIGGIGDPKW
jgi:hypothetical protein